MIFVQRIQGYDGAILTSRLTESELIGTLSHNGATQEIIRQHIKYAVVSLAESINHNNSNLQGDCLYDLDNLGSIMEEHKVASRFNSTYIHLSLNSAKVCIKNEKVIRE
ncbi:MAG: hypothetical protein V7782_11430 [Psychromonas sp.]